jgi:heterogeneous nuclear ribonucleoprotein A1/A3
VFAQIPLVSLAGGGFEEACGMAGYPEDNQHALNGYEEEEVDEEEGHPGRRGGRDGGSGYGDAGAEDGRGAGGDSSG